MNSIYSVIQGTGNVEQRVYVQDEGIYFFTATIKNIRINIGGVDGPMVKLKQGEYIVKVSGPKGYPFTVKARLIKTPD